jgi:hypothetical protein
LLDHPISDREVIAHHEASHAVLALELGLGILEIGIDLERVDATGGVGNVGCRLFVADLTDVAPRNLEAEQRRLAGRIDCSGTVLAAGAASDARLRGEDPWSALQKQETDFKHMRDLLQRARLDGTPEVAEERLRSQLDLAVEALEDPLVWQAVELVAREVLERGPLKGAEIEALVKPELEPADTGS